MELLKEISGLKSLRSILEMIGTMSLVTMLVKSILTNFGI